MFVFDQLACFAFEWNLAFHDDISIIADRQSQLYILLHKQDGQPLFPQLPQAVEQRDDQYWSEPERQFIDEKDGGIRHDPACYGKHLLLASAQCACLLSATLLQAREHLIDAF